ncbi:hypothetical protein S225a_09080 [Candidatus Brocadiaceae bacterium S225]|nr:hypothetical protein S225a_09080 [Candidatus Brocadiaceae bacterium S225]
MKPVRLFSDKIKDNLRTDTIGREVITLEQITSTMDVKRSLKLNRLL